MSYRSFKRVLGETNLERKCRFLFGGCLLLLILGSFYWYGRQTEKLVYEQNRNTGRLLVETIITRAHWENFKLPSRFADPDEQLFAKQLGEELKNFPYDSRFIRPDDADSPVQTKVLKPADKAEWDAWTRLSQGAPGDFQELRPQDKPEYHYFQAVRAKNQSCVNCHRRYGFKGGIGDMMSMAKIVIPDEETQNKLSLNRAFLWSTAIIIVFLAMVAAFVIVRYVVAKPLKHLKDVSDAISHGNIELRADIHTGDEFEELGRAFNRMLRHLVAIQEELRQVNGDLDGKVDELAQANLALFEMNRLKSDFLATMSHELRTPLNSILGFSEVLGSINALDDKQKRYVKNIQKSGKMLLDMINDILDLAKIESGKMELRLQDFRVDNVISAQCDLARPLTEKKNIDLETSIEPNLPVVHQDQGKVQQILGNLLSNAIKFTPEGGRIVVSAKGTGHNQVLLVVSDTGVGISEEDQRVIFEKFRQGSTVLVTGNAMTREYSGTGLGLSIVKELSKLLGGEISLESELGKGSTFTVRLPMALPDQVKLDIPDMEPLIDLSKARRLPFERPGVSSTSPASSV